jgi:hypothetical protein
MPPPTAVVSPRIHTPKISMPFFMAVIAPETAKAITPSISNAENKYCDIKGSSLPNFLHKKVYHLTQTLSI